MFAVSRRTRSTLLICLWRRRRHRRGQKGLQGGVLAERKCWRVPGCLSSGVLAKWDHYGLRTSVAFPRRDALPARALHGLPKRPTTATEPWTAAYSAMQLSSEDEQIPRKNAMLSVSLRPARRKHNLRWQTAWQFLPFAQARPSARGHGGKGTLSQ